MGTSSAMAFLLMFALISPILLIFSRPSYIGCENSTECGMAFCCLIGVGRFSIPECMSKGDEGSKCLTGYFSRSQNLTVSYPDGESPTLTNVYRMYCPCSLGLYCSSETETCTAFKHSNRIDTENFSDDD